MSFYEQSRGNDFSDTICSKSGCLLQWSYTPNLCKLKKSEMFTSMEWKNVICDSFKDEGQFSSEQTPYTLVKKKPLCSTDEPTRKTDTITQPQGMRIIITACVVRKGNNNSTYFESLWATEDKRQRRCQKQSTLPLPCFRYIDTLLKLVSWNLNLLKSFKCVFLKRWVFAFAGLPSQAAAYDVLLSFSISLTLVTRPFFLETWIVMSAFL